MSQKTIAIPDSDQTARRDIENDVSSEDVETGAETRQTSNKSGKRSAAKKLAASRPELGSSPGANPVPGAHGEPRAKEEETPSGAHRDKALRQKP
jgi:hypothetical protein